MKIACTGGGTGGHIMPIVAVVRELQRLHPKNDLQIFYLGPNDKEAILALHQEGVLTYGIFSGKIRRYFSFKNIADVLFTMPAGFLQSLFVLFFLRPGLLFSKGGSGSHMSVLAARLLRIPVFIHESDASPGMSNRAAARFATKIFTSFEHTEYFDKSKTELVGNPIKKELLEGNASDAKEIFNLTMQRPIVLFLGGSQGAQALNDVVISMLSQLATSHEIIHVCGTKNYKNVLEESATILTEATMPYYHAMAYLNEVDLKHAFAVATMIVSRAGSGGISEIAATGKPAILVPLPGSSFDHQSKNAYQYAATGAAEVLEQGSMTPNFLIGKINRITSDKTKYESMKSAALAFAKPLAAKAIARGLLEFLQN